MVFAHPRLVTGMAIFDRQEVDIERKILYGLEQKKNLSEISSLGIGGPCRYFLEVTQPMQLVSAVRCCRRVSMAYIVIGKGSNCLFDDRGFDGCVILNRVDSMERKGDGTYKVGSGYPFNRLGALCSFEGYSGLEFAGGIPGTVGGATFMNAGANGQETGDVIDSVEIVSSNGDVVLCRKEDLSFGYRWSVFQEMEDLGAIVGVTFKLSPCTSAEMRLKDYLKRRHKNEAMRERSAGSVFRNPSEIMCAGELIEKAGLKGLTMGGAKVSEHHANFFVNLDGASSSKNMLDLIHIVKQRVYGKFGITLEEEIRCVPYSINQ